MQIDAHQHFWHHDPVAFDWINHSMAAIRRDFLPSDLAPLASSLGIGGTIAVQARQSLGETDWLLELALAHPSLVRGVVGWLPLRERGTAITPLLEAYAARPALKGLRHVLQAEPDAYFSDPDFNAALGRLAAHGLSFDLLVVARQLRHGIALVDRHPALPVVLDHIGKPVVQGPPPSDWRAAISELARRPQVLCKFSGVVTEAPDWRWSTDIVRPYFETVLDAFGPSRLMFGSDWPVCQVAADYTDWFRCVGELVAPLSPSERAAILGGNAARFYRL